MASNLPAASPSRDRRTLYLGVGLVVLGALFLLARFLNIDLSVVPWPVWIAVGGGVLLIIGLLSRSFLVSLIVPGCMVIVAGLILLVQSRTGLWSTWAYAWTLVAPGAVGVGIALQGAVLSRPWLIRAGLRTMVTGLVLFLLGAALFELVFGLSGGRFNPVGRLVIPAALILLGLGLVAGSLIPRRTAS